MTTTSTAPRAPETTRPAGDALNYQDRKSVV